MSDRSAGSSYISRAFWSSIRAKSAVTQVYRGFAVARAATGKAIEETPGRRSGSQSRRGSTSSTRSVGEKEPSLLKKSVSKGQHLNGPVVSEAIKTTALGEKELLGAEKALRDFRATVPGRGHDRQTSEGKQAEQALEEEFVPVVSLVMKLRDRSLRLGRLGRW
jgi:hypothetical protein